MQVGDRVIYTGNYYASLIGVELTVWRFEHGKVSCTFPEQGRPRNPQLNLPKDTGITTWLLPEELTPAPIAKSF